MECLLWSKHVNSFLLFTCIILQIARSPGQFTVSRDQNRLVLGNKRTPMFQRFVPYQQSRLNSWRPRPFSLNRPELQLTHDKVSDRRFRGNSVPLTRSNFVRTHSFDRTRTRPYRNYIRQSELQRPRFFNPIVRNKPNSFNAVEGRKISVVNGPLSQVVPHPKPRNIQEKHRMRYRVVAKAKSFPGILKDTSLDVTTV